MSSSQQIVTSRYSPIDPFTEFRVVELQILLAIAQAKIEQLENRINGLSSNIDPVIYAAQEALYYLAHYGQIPPVTIESLQSALNALTNFSAK